MPDSSETNVPVKDWTTGTLKILHDDKISLLKELLDIKVDYERQIADERDKRYMERWQAQEVAGKRYQDVSNEFRGSLNDLSSNMATKVELITAINTLTEKIDVQANLISSLTSRLDVGNPELRTLQNQEANRTGVSQGSQITMGKIYAAIAAVGVIVSIIVLLANRVL